MKYVSIILLVTSLLFSCVEKPKTRHNDIHKIEFATSTCFGTCPEIYMILDSSLHFQYYGGQYADSQGYYKGQFSSGYWDTINRVFNLIDYKHMPDSFEACCDGSLTELYIHHGSSEKHFYGMYLPTGLFNILSWFHSTTKGIPIQKSDSMYFRCTAEKAVIPPPL